MLVYQQSDNYDGHPYHQQTFYYLCIVVFMVVYYYELVKLLIRILFLSTCIVYISLSARIPCIYASCFPHSIYCVSLFCRLLFSYFLQQGVAMYIFMSIIYSNSVSYCMMIISIFLKAYQSLLYLMHTLVYNYLYLYVIIYFCSVCIVF